MQQFQSSLNFEVGSTNLNFLIKKNVCIKNKCYTFLIQCKTPTLLSILSTQRTKRYS